MTEQEAGLLELRGITKRYPGVVANDAIDLSVEPGEVHAIVGENGAGKSTLMSILYGLVKPDAGSIRIRGDEVGFGSPLDAIKAGLGMVHQSFQLFPSLTVAQNVVYNTEPTRWGLIDGADAKEGVADLADRYGLAVDPTAKVEDLPVGVLQRVEILKALYRNARIVILDEPTAVLTPQERDNLFDVLRLLSSDGRTVLFITHKLGEVMAVSDRVTVLRRGRVVAEAVTSETNPRQISRHMTGRHVEMQRIPSSSGGGGAVLGVRDVTIVDDHGMRAIAGVDLTVRSEEIVGIAGVAGNGQTELIEGIIGLRPVTSGAITVSDRDITHDDVLERRTDIAYIPEDRHHTGTAAGGTVADNLLIGFQRALSTGGWLDRSQVGDHARRLIESYDIKIAGPDNPVTALSGGNLQKVVVARELAHEAPLLIAEQPTRGVDVGAVEFVHSQLAEYRDAGGAILLVSAELSEILALSTRILVMFEGRLVAELDPDTTDETEIGFYMTGGREQRSA